ncbi:HSP20-like chaperone [Delitschia confertaspora ATCC 74209]|uniref:HSP20-like chaperone n=1 Tax=Delitschia confertaspora ATCC 74209 TaxID=1513339 RepID=A0A9P4MVI0_9PLEO|nr:HSP20-like chaperone [Delitschia confertaspora ATCC 74209]
MATFLMPRVAFAPAYCSPSRSYYGHPFAPNPRVSVNSFLSLIDDSIDRLQREVKRQTQQQRSFNARFDVRENQEGYQVYGDVPGFEQENIDIEISDEHTLKISGSTEKRAQPQIEVQPETEKMEVEVSSTEAPQTVENSEESRSETSSVKSYQPTVEDDFEDLGAHSDTVTTPASFTISKGEEKATEEPKSTDTAVIQSQPERQAPVQQQQKYQDRSWISERSFGSFTRTFRFPARIDSANVRASLRNGVLSVTVPKAPVPQIRRIMIQ